MGLCGPFGPRVEVFLSVDVYVNIVYIMPTIGRCMSVGVYIDIGYILPIIGGYVTVVGCLWALRAQGRYVCQLLYKFILYISCQQSWDV